MFSGLIAYIPGSVCSLFDYGTKNNLQTRKLELITQTRTDTVLKRPFPPTFVGYISSTEETVMCPQIKLFGFILGQRYLAEVILFSSS